MAPCYRSVSTLNGREAMKMSDNKQELTPFEAGTLVALEGVGIALQKLSNIAGSDPDKLSNVLSALLKMPPDNIKDDEKAVAEWSKPLNMLLLGAKEANKSDTRNA
ncbi:hypothetical protein Pfra02_45180 [Pseudomonas fragi]|nr:hypothetical protein Pfra02_45180 [Pseudomonas fragi]